MTVSRKFWTEVGNSCREGLKSLLLLLLGLYRTIGTTHLGGNCRFEPSCSHYAVEAVQQHHPFVALRLIIGRVLKCRPGGPWGFDPVPPVLLPVTKMGFRTCLPEKHEKREQRDESKR